jgi:hypothetical protein
MAATKALVWSVHGSHPVPHPEPVEGRRMVFQVLFPCSASQSAWTNMMRPSTSSGWGIWWPPRAFTTVAQDEGVGAPQAVVAPPNLPHPELVEGRRLFGQSSFLCTVQRTCRIGWTISLRPSTSSGWGIWWPPRAFNTVAQDEDGGGLRRLSTMSIRIRMLVNSSSFKTAVPDVVD